MAKNRINVLYTEAKFNFVFNSPHCVITHLLKTNEPTLQINLKKLTKKTCVSSLNKCVSTVITSTRFTQNHPDRNIISSSQNVEKSVIHESNNERYIVANMRLDVPLCPQPPPSDPTSRRLSSPLHITCPGPGQ